LKILLDFETKPSYTPVIDLVNELSKKFDVFLIPNRKFPPNDLNDNVVCCKSIGDVRTINFDVVFSTYSTLLAVSYLKARLKSPLVNYMFIPTMINEVLSDKFLALPNSYKLREMLNLLVFPLPKSLFMPDRLIVPNLMVWKELVKLGFPKDKIVTLPWGLNVARYEKPDFLCKNSPIINDEGVIVYAGPLHPLRFSTKLLYSFSNVIKQNADAHLFLLFRKDLWNQCLYIELLSTIKNLGLMERVSIIIPSSYGVYLSYVAQAEVVVLPYFSSGIVEMPPFTLLECMALSKPIITSRGIATFGIVEDGINGFIMPENSSSLADLVNFLISNKKKAHYVGQKARMFVQERYNLTHFCSKLSQVFENCCR